MRVVGIRVLGALELDGDAPLSPRARIALCTLILRRPAPVPLEELADASWGPTPPSTWPSSCTPPWARSGGRYPTGRSSRRPRAGTASTCRATRWTRDEFVDGIARARGFAATGEPDRASSAFSRALAIWRGQPFANLNGWSGAASEVARLTELRLTCQEDLAEAQLAAGEHRLVASEARSLVTQDPLRERRWAILALAQYRCGRQGDALRTLRDARQLLANELGIDPGAQLADLELAILRQDPAIAAPEATPTARADCPYRGLAAFGIEDSQEFFGRTAEIDQCLDRLARTPLLVIAGPSGAGKSSLARAGVAAALEREGAEPVVLLPGPDPIGALETAIGDAPPDAAIVVDQLEDLFLSGYPDAVVRVFCRRLAAAADTRHVIVTVRADQIAGLSTDAHLAQLAERGLHLVRPLSDDQLREVIEQPARLAGLRLEHGLVELLVKEAGDGAGSLPLLSHALVETWRRRDGSVLTVDGYNASGGISAAVAQTAERVYEGTPSPTVPRVVPCSCASSHRPVRAAPSTAVSSSGPWVSRVAASAS